MSWQPQGGAALQGPFSDGTGGGGGATGDAYQLSPASDHAHLAQQALRLAPRGQRRNKVRADDEAELVRRGWEDRREARHELEARERDERLVERGDFAISDETTGWTVSGKAATGAIDLSIDANPPGDGPALKPYRLSTQLAEALLQAPRRPDNTDALYRRRHYATDKPIGHCPP